MDDTSQKRIRYLAAAVCGLLLLIVAIVFGRTVQYDFVNFDDDAYVYENPHVTHGLTRETAAWSLTTFRGCNWHPLTWLSHATDCQLYGTQNAGGHHLTNVVLHAAVAILLLLVLWQMTGNLWPSALVAAVFAVHPLRVESVAWVAERKDLLSGLFFMLTLAAYLHYVRHPFSWARYLLVAAVFTLGLMAKPMLVTLPLVLLLLDYWPLGRFSITRGDKPLAASHLLPAVSAWRLIAEKVPLLMLAGVSCVVTSLAQSRAIVPVDIVPIASRIANALVSYVAYIGQFFYPTGLAVFYPYPEDGLPVWKIVVAAAVLGGISVAALLAWRRLPYLFVGWFWYVGMLVPVIGLVQVGSQAMADRYTYLPQIGLCIALAWGAANVAIGWPYRRLAYSVGSVLLVVALMACTWRQTAFWRNSETLWTRASECTPRNALVDHNLGMALAGRNELDAAARYYRRALETKPDYALAHNNLAKVLERQGRKDEAIVEYGKAIESDPGYADAYNSLGVVLADRGRLDAAIAQFIEALAIKPDDALTHNNLAKALERQGRKDEAIVEYGKAIALDPDYATAQNDLGVILASRGQLDAAIALFRKALELKSDSAKIHVNLGTALSEKGAIRDAMAHWREAIRLQPGNLLAVNQLAWTMATRPEASVRNGKEAAELAQWAVRLSREQEPVPLGTLAAAYAEAGRFSDAVKTADRAISLAAARGDAATADALRRQSQFYRTGSPYHEPPAPRLP
jgi:tetratricopeptide (TPR) repeat protein